MSDLSLPDSYRSYRQDISIQTAVDHLLEEERKKNSTIPSDLVWSDLNKYYSAVLSAHQVRTEYAQWLVSLWDAIWQKALDSWENPFEIGTWDVLKDVQDEIEVAHFMTKDMWSNEEVVRLIDLTSGDESFQLHLYIQEDSEDYRKLTLWLQLWDYQTEAWIDDIELQDTLWQFDGSSWFHTNKAISVILDDNAVDVTQALNIAKDALSVIGRRLQI